MRFAQLIATVPREGNEHLLRSSTGKDGGMSLGVVGLVVRAVSDRSGLLLWRTAPLTLSCRDIITDALLAEPEVLELLRQRSEAK